MKLNRAGLREVLMRHSKVSMAREWGISLPTLRKYEAGAEPKSRVMVEYLNKDIARLLVKTISLEDALLRYLNDFANHRISVDSGAVGVDTPIQVLRYPSVEPTLSRYDGEREYVWMNRRHLNEWLDEKLPLDGPRLRPLMHLYRTNLCAETGIDERKLTDCYKVSVVAMGRLRELLNEAGNRPDPEQDGIVR